MNLNNLATWLIWPGTPGTPRAPYARMQGARGARMSAHWAYSARHTRDMRARARKHLIGHFTSSLLVAKLVRCWPNLEKLRLAISRSIFGSTRADELFSGTERSALFKNAIKSDLKQSVWPLYFLRRRGGQIVRFPILPREEIRFDGVTGFARSDPIFNT